MWSLARESGMRIVGFDGTAWMASASRGAPVEVANYEELLERGVKATLAGARRRADRSIEESLAHARLSSRVHDLTRSFFEGFHAGPAAELSTRALARGGGGGAGATYRFIDGYDALVDLLASRAGDVRTGVVARRVEHGRHRVRIHGVDRLGNDVLVLARRAIVALPLGVLQAPATAEGGVAFDPPIRWSEAAKRLATGQVTKLHLRFREPFWHGCVPAEDRSAMTRAAYVFDPRGAFRTFWSTRPVASPIVTAWAGAPHGERLAMLEPAALMRTAVDAFADAVGANRRRARSLFVGAAYHDWHADPLARGAYSFIRVGGEGGPAAWRKSVGETLYFAGEHTCDPPDNGTVHGAVESGRRAARRCLRGG